MSSQRRISERERLRKEVSRLLNTVERMKAASPLMPVWPGLAVAKPDHKIGDPPEPTAEDREICGLREPLVQFLKDAARCINDHGTPEQGDRFQGNALVRVAFHGRLQERRRYPKADCLADLRSLGKLLAGVGRSRVPSRPGAPTQRGSLNEKLRAAREAAGQNQEQAAAEIGIDAKALGQYERGVREPRKNLSGLKSYIARHLRRNLASPG